MERFPYGRKKAKINPCKILVLFLGVNFSLGLLPSVKCVSLLLQKVQASYKARDTYHLCGNRLVTAIQAVCDGHAKVDGLYTGKVDGQGPLILQPEINSQGRRLPSQWDVKRSSFISRWRRGVSDECCRKPCNTSQLLKYCAVRDDPDNDPTWTSTPPPKIIAFEEDEPMEENLWSSTEEDRPALEIHDFPFLPLLLDLFWEQNTVKDPGERFKFRNFPPQQVPGHQIYPPLQKPPPHHKPSGSSTQRRDTYGISRQTTHPPSRVPPTNNHRFKPITSDETRRDFYSYEDESLYSSSMQEPISGTSHHVPAYDRPASMAANLLERHPLADHVQPPPTMISRATVKVDEDLPDSFPIFGGTNNDWVGI